MTTPKASMRLAQLDRHFSNIRALAGFQPPRRGWLLAIRNALNMSLEQFARRLGMTRAGVADLERREAAGNVTLNTLRTATAALDCVLVYAIVPRTSLHDMVARQARLVAEQRQARVSHTMQLEGQGITEAERAQAIQDNTDELVRTLPRLLWDITPSKD